MPVLHSLGVKLICPLATQWKEGVAVEGRRKKWINVQRIPTAWFSLLSQVISISCSFNVPHRLVVGGENPLFTEEGTYEHCQNGPRMYNGAKSWRRAAGRIVFFATHIDERLLWTKNLFTFISKFSVYHKDWDMRNLRTHPGRQAHEICFAKG